METSLFSKYKKEIEKQKNKKQTLIAFIQETTNIVLKEEEIEIKKNQIILHTTSVKKTTLHQKNIQTTLKKQGFTSTSFY